MNEQAPSKEMNCTTHGRGPCICLGARYWMDRALAASSGEPGLHHWWCDTCQRQVENVDVTYDETHDLRAGGCGQHVFARPAQPPGVRGEDNANTAADRPSAITAGEAAASDGDSVCPVLSPNSLERAKIALRAIYDATAEDGLHENKALFNVAREALGYLTATKGEAP